MKRFLPGVDPEQTVHPSQLPGEVVMLRAGPGIIQRALIHSLVHDDARVNPLMGIDFIDANHSRPTTSTEMEIGC